MVKSLSFLSVLLFFTACSSTVRYQKVRYETDREEKVKVVSDDKVESEVEVTDDEVLETQTGVASFYADKYHGLPTYSGEIYDMHGLSAAHQTYRMGTIVRVTNLYNKKSVIIPINDRMPFWPDRIIDLSYGTAIELDMLTAGIVDVKVEVLKWGEGRK